MTVLGFAITGYDLGRGVFGGLLLVGLLWLLITTHKKIKKAEGRKGGRERNAR